MRTHSSFYSFFRFIALLGLTCGILFVLMFFRSSQLTAVCELEPAEQWIVRQERPGEIVARHTLGRKQAVQSAKLFSFPDEDIVTILMVSNYTEGSYVTENTPVMKIHSVSDTADAHVLSAQVHRLEEELKLYYDGEFQAKEGEAIAALARAQTNLLTYMPIIQKRRELVEKGILSRDELDFSEDEFAARKQAVEIARAELETRRKQISTGVIEVARAAWEEALREYEHKLYRLSNSFLTTPIEGRITRDSGDPAVLMRVVNENKLVARVILPLSYKGTCRIGDPVSLSFEGISGVTVTSVIETIDIESVPTPGQSMLHILIPVNDMKDTLRVSMTGYAQFKNVQINPVDIVRDRITRFFGGEQ